MQKQIDMPSRKEKEDTGTAAKCRPARFALLLLLPNLGALTQYDVCIVTCNNIGR